MVSALSGLVGCGVVNSATRAKVFQISIHVICVKKSLRGSHRGQAHYFGDERNRTCVREMDDSEWDIVY